MRPKLVCAPAAFLLLASLAVRLGAPGANISNAPQTYSIDGRQHVVAVGDTL